MYTPADPSPQGEPASAGPAEAKEKSRWTLWPISVLGFVWFALLVSVLVWGLVDQANAKIDTGQCAEE